MADFDNTTELLKRLVARDRVRSEATVQTDVHQFLLTGGLGLAEHDLEVELETQLGDRRRIDIEVGQTVIEVKRGPAFRQRNNTPPFPRPERVHATPAASPG